MFPPEAQGNWGINTTTVSPLGAADFLALLAYGTNSTNEQRRCPWPEKARPNGPSADTDMTWTEDSGLGFCHMHGPGARNEKHRGDEK